MRRFLKVVLPCFILSLSAEAALKKALLEEEIKTMIETIEREFYKNQPFTVFDVYKIVPQVILMENGDSKRPNSGLMPIEEDETELKMGVSVNAALLEIRDANAVLFAVAHELGHAFSSQLLVDINCAGINGAATEVIADLGAMWILNRKGLSFSVIEKTVSDWQKSDIFDVEKAGDHPPGAERAGYVIHAIKGLQAGRSFSAVVSDIVRKQLNTDCPSQN